MPVVPVRERLSCRPRASSQTVLLKSVLALMELLPNIAGLVLALGVGLAQARRANG